jgi:hypothetical protein
MLPCGRIFFNFEFFGDLRYFDEKMKEKILRLNLYIGLSIFLISALLLILQVSFMRRWFFTFAWWSFILVIDSLNFRKKRYSPLSGPAKDFLFTAFISVFIWLIFELFNLRLKNWSYHSLPTSLAERWLGYFVAFATVVPALQEISLFTEGIFKKKKLALFRVKGTSLLLNSCVLSGAASIVLALAWPRIFFPLAWLCFIFLLEPLNFWLKNKTFLKDLEQGEWAKFWNWALAGLVAGFLWELWNFWAGSHWEYLLPVLNFWRVFKMPVFGYSGFLPFALEVYALYQLLFALYKKIQGKIFLESLASVILLLFYSACFSLIDRLTLVV